MVFPAKYRRAVFDDVEDKTLRDVCLELEKRYQLKFLEIGTDEDHVHFLVQSVPSYSVTKLVTVIKRALQQVRYFACVLMSTNDSGAVSFRVMVILRVLLVVMVMNTR